MNIEYKIYNRDKKLPWLVLVNGLFANLKLWESSIDKLSELFQVLCYNCDGQGARPEVKYEYLLDDHVQDLFDLLHFLEIDRAHLVGISNGGRIALKFAALYPSICLKTVACDTYDEVSNLMSMKIKSWLKAQEIGDQEHRFDISTPWIFGETFLKENENQLMSFRKNAVNQNKDAVAGLIRGALTGHVDLKMIKTPVLYLAGEEDVLTPYYLHERMYEKTKGAKIKKIAGGHASLYEYPENIEKHVIPYLVDSNEVAL